jgi:hypothetical protein
MTTPDTAIVLNQDGQETDLLAPDGLAFLNPADMPDLDNAEVGYSLTAESLEFKNPGEFVRAIYNGITTVKVKDQANPGKYVDHEAVVLQAKTGIKLNLGANLLKQLKLVPIGTAVQVTYKGEEPTNGGRKVKVYEVNALNVARSHVPAPVAQPKPAPAPTTHDPAERIWSVAQKNALITAGLATNDFAAKGMLDLSTLPADAMGFEIVDWGTAYREQRTAINPETGHVYTAPQAANHANTRLAKAVDKDDLPY